MMRGHSCFSLISLLFSITLGLLSQGCSSSASLPPWVEVIQRTPFHTIQVNEQRVAYLDVGQGTPIILIHGFGGSMWHWEYQYLSLGQSHRVIIPDLVGSGLSDKPKITYSPEHIIQFFKDFMRSLNIEKAILIGNSLGAGMAMAMALEHPEAVERLVLISGFPAEVEGNIASEQYRKFLQHRPPIWLASLANQVAGRSATERLLKEIVYKPELISASIVERSFQNRQQKGLLPPLYSMLDHIHGWETRFGQQLVQIDHPTLLLWGEHDRIFPVEVGKQVKTLLPHAEWHVIPESGHLPQWEQPQIVNSLILSFLGKSF